MSKYTPGPWESSQEYIQVGTKKDIPGGWEGIAFIYKNDLGESTREANALLISKAPEMYELLKELEWNSNDPAGACICCLEGEETKKHNETCELGNLLEELKELESYEETDALEEEIRHETRDPEPWKSEREAG